MSKFRSIFTIVPTTNATCGAHEKATLISAPEENEEESPIGLLSSLIVLVLLSSKRLSHRKEGIQIQERVPEFTSERNEGRKMLVNSCIRELDRKGMRVSRKSGAARPPEGG